MSRSRSDFTGIDTQTGSGSLASIKQTISFSDLDNDGFISISDAINSINSVASITKVKASLINGSFTLTQIDNLNSDDVSKYNTVGGANTAGEGDTINFTLHGNGDFAFVTGFGSYSVSGQADTGSMASQARSVLSGSTSVSEADQFLNSSVTFTGLTQDNTAISKTLSLSGNLYNAISQINSAGLGITASISNGKFTLTSDFFSELGISVSGNSDFLRVAGLGSFSIGGVSKASAAGSDLGYHSHGVSTSSILQNGSIKSGTLSIQGKSFDVINMEVEDVVNLINSSGVALAEIKDSSLIIQASLPGDLSISASGDAARVLGLAYYSNDSASSSAGAYYNHWNYSYELWSQKYDAWDTSLDYSGYDSHDYDTSREVNYTTYTTGTIWDTNYTTHTTGTNWDTDYTTHIIGTNWKTNTTYSYYSSISGYDTSIETNSSITDYVTEVIPMGGWSYSSELVEVDFEILSVNSDYEDNGDWDRYDYYCSLYSGEEYVVDYLLAREVNWNIAQGKYDAIAVSKSTTYSTWVDYPDETKTTDTLWDTKYTTHTTGTNYDYWDKHDPYIDSYDISIETNSWIASYDYSTETNSWIASYLTSTDTNWTTWYYETYWTKDYSSSYDTETQDGYYDAPAFTLYNNDYTQYRNVQSTHVDDTSSYSYRSRSSKPTGAGTITSGASNYYASDSAFAGQIAGTVTIVSSRYGNIATVSYSEITTVNDILDDLKNITVYGKDGKSHSVFYDLDPTGGYTDGYFGAVYLEDSGNALKLLGLATSGIKHYSTKAGSSNSDYNGINKGTATLTSSLGGFSSSSVRPFQGSGSFYVYVGNHVAGKVNYTASSTIGDVINQINNFSYVYDSGVSVSSPFKNLAKNDDNSFITDTLEDGSTPNAYVQNGKIYYTAQLQAFLDSQGHIVIKSDVYDNSPQAISIKNDTASFSALTGISNSNHNYSSNSTLKNGDEGIYTFKGASVPGLNSSSNLTFVGGNNQGFFVTIDDGNRNDTNYTVNLAQRKFFVNVYENDTVQNILDRITQQANNLGIGLNFSAKVENNTIVFTIDGKFGEAISFSNDNSGFIQRAGLATTSKTYAENKISVIESYGYDRITGSVNTISKSHILGNLSSESFSISGSNGTFNVSVQSGWSVQKIIDEIYNQTNGHYKAGIFNNAESNYDNASVGHFYIESTVQSPVNTSVSSTDLTRRLGLVSVNQSTGPSSQTTTGDHGYFNYTSSSISGLKPNSIISGLKNGKLTFTLHSNNATGQTGSVTYRPTTSYTIDVVYNDTASSILNKMKQAILKTEDDSLEHSDITGDNRLDRLDFKVVYDSASNQGYLSLQLIGNYASAITFDSDSSGFSQALGLDKISHSYSPNFDSQSVSSGKSMTTGSISGLNLNHIFANMKTGSLTISAGSVSKTINIASNDRIQDIINKIQEGNIFNAGLDSQGHLFIKTTGQNNSNIQLSGSSDFAQLTGLSQGSWAFSSTQEIGNKNFSKITGSVFGLSASQVFNNMTSGSFSISSSGLATININVSQGITSVQDVINQINTSSDYNAYLDDSGRFIVSTNKANGASISINSASTNYSTVIGLTQGTLGGNASFSSGSKDIYSSLNGSATGLNSSMRFSKGDFSISVSAQNGSTVSQSFSLSGNESLSDIASIISNSNLNISAIIDSNNNSLILKSKTAGQYTISLQDGTSDFAELTGFTKNGNQSSSTTSGKLSSLTSSLTVQAAAALGFSNGNFTISLTDASGSITNSQAFNISSLDSIDSIISKINASSLGVTASINSTGNFVLTRNSSTQAGSISVTKGTSDFTNVLGFTQGGTSSASASASQGQNSTQTTLSSVSLSAQLADSLSSLGISSGSFSINGISISVSDSDSVSSLLLKINSAFASSDKNGVTAIFKDNKIILNSNFASANSRINIESGSSNISDILGFTNNSSLNTNSQSLGLNSKFSINGQLHEALSNTISLDSLGNIIDSDSASESIRFTIKNTGAGTVDIGKKALDNAFSLLNSFVNKFNNSQALSQNPSISSDPHFINLLNSIHSALTDSVGSYKLMSKELNDIGITIYSSSSSSSQATKLSISLNKDKFINSFLKNPQKILDILVGDDSKPIDKSKAGAFVRLQDSLSSAVNDYFSSSVKNLESQAKNLSYQLANASAELNNTKASLAFDNSASPASDNMADYLKQLENQYNSVNNLIKKMKNQYNQSISRLVLNGK